MIYYRLLRDNKETGPYSEEEMIAKGFKPYDLLWAEGKSAGWQYPSEINAFKKYAPIVEEQPYDRFYKKQPPQKLITEERYPARSYAASIKNTERTETAPPPPAARPATVYNYNVQDLPARHIHVTLPSGNTVNLTALARKEPVAKEPAAANNNMLPEPAATPANKPAEQKQLAATQTNTPVAKPISNTAIPEPVKTVTAAYPAAQPVYTASANGSFSWSLVLGGVVGIATMVGLGIMIGLSMNRTKNDAAFNDALINRSRQQPSAAIAVTPAPANVPASPAVATAQPVVQKPQAQSAVKSKELVQHALVKTTLAPANTNATAKEEKKLPMGNNDAAEKNNTAVRQELPVQHNKVSPAVPVVNIEKNLSISANDFKTGAFGGISGLKCTLFNGSKLPLESVEVAIDYIQANNKIYKTEKLLFSNVSAGAQATLDAPASSRGVKVISRIIKISAKEAALSNTTAKS